VRDAAAVVLAGFRAELQQMRRSRLLVVLTLVQAVTFLLMVSVFGLTGSRAPTALVDRDGGVYAKRFAADLAAAHHSFALRPMDAVSAQNAVMRGDVVAMIVIPPGFSRAIAAGDAAHVDLSIDNVNADLTNDVQRAVPTAILAFSRENHLPGLHIRPAETDLIAHDTGFIPYLVVSALALDAFVVAGILGATAVAREFESRTIAGLAVSPVSPLLPLAGRALATSVVSAGAMALTAAVVVLGYGVHPVHPLEMAGALLLCVLIFSCVGVAVGGLMKRTLPVASLLFGLALPLYIDSGSLEPERFDGNVIWGIAHSSPVYSAVGLLQNAAHGLRVTPEPMAVDAAALAGWALLALALARFTLRRGVRA
jgi:ABC-2 type transport system permease protein